MPLTYKDWHEREPGHGTDPSLEPVLENTFQTVKQFWKDLNQEEVVWDHYFLETAHKASMYVNTGKNNSSEVGGYIASKLHEMGYDRVDLEIFYTAHLIVTIPDTEKNATRVEGCSGH